VLQLPMVLLGAGLVGLVAVVLMRLRGLHVDAATRLPLGTLMALAAWPIWLAGIKSIQPVSRLCCYNRGKGGVFPRDAARPLSHRPEVDWRLRMAAEAVPLRRSETGVAGRSNHCLK
jgi:hypothetical protein